MKQMTKYKGKKVIVIGLARSGMSAAKLLHRLGAFVTVNDLTPIAENNDAQALEKEGIRVVTGGHPVELLDKGFDYLVKNPGIPYENVMVKGAIERNIPVLTEVELAYAICDAEIIGVTGTNGKTTVVMMLDKVMNKNQENSAKLAGNIGFPASTVAQTMEKNQYMITELSSFQLMGIESFRPHIALITNLFEAHLDYHHTRKEYIEAKLNIQKNMTADDYLILNIDQKEGKAVAQYTKAQVISVSLNNQEATAYCHDGKLYYKTEYIMDAKEIGVPGKHNIYNALMVIACAKLCHLSNEVIREGIQSFKGATHRLQYVTEINGVSYYNDSKATNAESTKSALSGFEPTKLTLLLGGLDRGDEGELTTEDLKNVHCVIAFGETRDKMEILAKRAGVSSVYKVETIAEAVPLAQKVTKKGATVLLSPAHASWDQYKTFEERGDDFMNEVKKLKG